LSTPVSALGDVAQHAKVNIRVSQTPIRSTIANNLEVYNQNKTARKDMYNNLKLESLKQGKRSCHKTFVVMKTNGRIYVHRETIDLAVDAAVEYLDDNAISQTEWRTEFSSK
jgi:hypothetical protein